MSRRPDSAAWMDANAVGERAEERVAAFWRKRGWDSLKVLGNAGEFDLELRTQVEVKADRQAGTTGNVAVEVARDRKPSGVATSTAAFWCIVVGDAAIWVPRATLRELVNVGGYRAVAAGDGKRTTCVLVPLDELKRVPSAKALILDGEA